ncbi:MAG: hypothetical protein AAF512_00260 [Pseudomonadota bacterium]
MDTLLQEFRENIRLRLGVWAVCIIVAIYVMLVLHDHKEKLRGEYAQVNGHLARLKDVASQAEWAQRAQDAKTLRLDAEKKLWSANSRGLAGATLQSWLDTTIRTIGIERSRIQIESPQEITGEQTLWKASAQVDGLFTPEKLRAMLLKMSENSEWIITERLEVRPSAPPTFSLLVTSYFLPTVETGQNVQNTNLQ